MKRIIPITRKVNAIIIISLIVGIGGITSYFAVDIFSTIDRSTSTNLMQQGDLLYTSIRNFMLPGEAPLAVTFFSEISEINPDFSIRLFRRDGIPAFSDDKTIMEVNSNIGEQLFMRREPVSETVEPMVDERFSSAVGMPPTSQFFEAREDGAVFVRIYRPLINLPKCALCHGGDHTVRGVIYIRNDITESVTEQNRALWISGGFFFAIVVLLAVVLSQFMKATIISPVKIIGHVCAEVTDGHFSERVEIKNHDEIGILGETVNKMVQGLHERFELSKFVSSSTIAALGNTEKGQRVPVTMFFSDIRGFTSFSERQQPEEVVDYLNRVLNFQTEIINKYNGDIDKYVGDEIVAMFTEDRGAVFACAAAIEIQRELHENSESQYGGLRVGIGINTGDVILGMIGSHRRADFTVVGDNVNVTSRLCDVARRGEVLLSEDTYEAVKEHAVVNGPVGVQVKGKKAPLRVYRLKSIQLRRKTEQ